MAKADICGTGKRIKWLGEAGFVGMLLLCLFVLPPYCLAMKIDGQWYWQEDPVCAEGVPGGIFGYFSAAEDYLQCRGKLLAEGR